MSPASPPKCSVCGLLYEAHGDERCDFCGRPLEHHKPGDLEAEEAGRLRMAQARQAAGSVINHIDYQVLRRAQEAA